ncbi:MAG: hemerythrin domain-containing protein [Candidatus Omnitrophica bacterium]|nr:hemerythrin domain-containing protein [Candidatus Omnitrophota bacterium]
MLPIAPLMIEHRVIERMIRLMKDELRHIRSTDSPHLGFLEAAVDFIRTYVDQCHHGKEEDILFGNLQKKKPASQLTTVMNKLIEEHAQGRETVKKLVEAKNRYLNGDLSAAKDMAVQIEFLIEFYPRHIDKEDNHFFQPCMDYFTDDERGMMLKAFFVFDQRLIHRKYKDLVENFEKNGLNLQS